MWLGEQITQRGVGNGTSLIIFSGIVARLPAALIGTLELGRTGALELWVILLIAVVVVGVIAFIVYFERAQRGSSSNIPSARWATRCSGARPPICP
jgi:Preprotein translocase subunit SecY